ncbi:MAG TPA: serine hydrolase [Candidatus Doudnabacteria bacterium]|nr:serine hydrolase [Candidatus Doudnabacteria bacterium]
MKRIFRQLPFLILVGIFFYLNSVLIAYPALAPTANIKILGASTSEQEILQNFKSFEVATDNSINSVRAASFLIQDLDSNQLIGAHHPDTSLPVASLTKLMTVWTALQYADMDEVVTVNHSAYETVSPSLGLLVGDEVKLSDLIYACLIGSSNDAARTIADYIGTKMNLPFSELMNQQAAQLGMKNSRFSNAMGFDSVVNYSSARDLSLLVKALTETGVFEQTWQAGNYRFTGKLGRIYQTTATNKLLNTYPDLRAIKTGFTNTALGSMITVVTTGTSRTLIIVIGSPDREGDTLQLRAKILAR